MPKSRHLVLRLAVVAFVVLTAEGVLHRDPCVQFRDGYSIVATSWGEPCFLNYEPWNDGRTYSTWRAMTSRSLDEAGNGENTYLLLDSSGENGSLKFDTPEPWDAAQRAKNAVPDRDVFNRIRGITGYAAVGDFIVGNRDSGYFILDIPKNTVEAFASESEWKRAVESQTGAPPERLRDPKSWFVQSRAPVVWAVMAAIALGAIPWVILPLRRDRPPVFEMRQE